MAKSPKRKEYLKEYRQGADGKYTYGGLSYRYEGTEQERLKAYKRLGALGIVLLIAVVVSGLNDAEAAIRSFYVIIPFIGEICALFALLWNLTKLVFEGRDIRGYVFEAAGSRIAPAALMLLLFAVLGAASAVIFIIWNGTDSVTGKDVLYPVSKLLDALLAFYFRKYYNSLRWSVI